MSSAPRSSSIHSRRPFGSASPVTDPRALQAVWSAASQSAGRSGSRRAKAKEATEETKTQSPDSSPERRGKSEERHAYESVVGAPSDGDASAPSSPLFRPSTGFNGRSASSAAHQQPSLPPHLSHLYFPSQTFPTFLLSIASRLFHAKMHDLGIKDRNVDKERRFVWLVCRQSMGASGTATNSTTSLATAAPSLANVEVGLMSLRVPDASLGPTAVREICHFLAQDTRFAHLQLTGNILGDEGAVRMAQLLTTNTNLTSLDLRATGLGQSAFATVLNAITTHPTLTALDASSVKSEGRMYLGVKGCKALARVLKHNTVLRKLHLSNAGVVSEGVSSIVRGLQLNRTLTSLDLSCNDLTSKSMAKFGEAFLSLHTLHSLVLGDNLIGTVGCVILCETLRKMESLKKLDLRRNGIGLKGFTVLTDTVGEMISLSELLFDGNMLGESTRHTILSQASVASSSTAAANSANEDFKNKDYVDTVVKRLHLTDKRVSPRILLQTALRTLSLNNCNISDRLVDDLCAILKSHKGLQSLHVGSNLLTDLSGRPLAELIRTSTSLETLQAYENNIQDDGGSEMAIAAATPTSQLSFISLRVNNVGKLTATGMIHALSLRKTLHVDFGGNKIPWILYSKVLEISTRNRRLFEASLSSRYQSEWERLQQRHEYRLSVEDQVLDSVDQVAELESQLDAIVASKGKWIDGEQNETRVLQQELADWSHSLHEVHAVERSAELELQSLIKEMEGRVTSLRKATEKEQRFIQSAEKLIPQTIEELAKVNEEMEVGLVDFRRDLRLYTTDRNVEYDSLLVLKDDLTKFIREMESHLKPLKSPKKGASSSSSVGHGSVGSSRPQSRPQSRPHAMGAPTARPGRTKSPQSAKKKGTSSNTATPSKASSATSSTAAIRPPSATRMASLSSASSRPQSALRTTPASQAGTRPPSASAAKGAPSRPESAANKDSAPPSARKQRAATAPQPKGAKKGTAAAPKKEAAPPNAQPNTIQPTDKAHTPPPADGNTGGSSIEAVAMANALMKA